MNLPKERILFVCETKAQLFNAINIKLNVLKEKISDVCLCDNGCNNLSNLYSKVNESNVFNNTYVYHTRHDTDQSAFGKFRRAFRSISLVKNTSNALPNREIKYSMIFISGPSSSVNGVYYHLKKMNNSIKLFLYEEGIYEYYMFNNKYLIRRLYSQFIYHRYYLDDAEGVYVYSPKLLTGDTKNKKIIAISPISFNDTNFVCAINSIFSIEVGLLSVLKNIKYLYMDQAFPSREENEQQYQIVQRIAEIVGKDNIGIKLHPNSLAKKYKEYSDLCIKTNMAMEVIELNLQLRELTLLTICSSSVFNFKLLFDVNPRIILLYKMFKSVTIGKNIFKFVEVFQKDYSGGEVYSPTTIEELESIL